MPLLRLRFRTPNPLRGTTVPALTLAATLNDLAVLFDLAAKAWDHQVPLASLLEAIQAANPDAALDVPHDFGAYLWTADRLLPRGVPRDPTLSSDELARLQERVVVYRQSAFLVVTSLTARDLELEATFRLTQPDVDDGGALWVFLQAVERLFRAPGHVAAEGLRCGANTEHDRARAAVALQGLDTLWADMADVELIDGELSED